MTLQGSVRAQLFHTYTTVPRLELSASERVAEVAAGLLTLYPHEQVEIGTSPSWAEDPLEDANWRFQYHSLVWLDRYRAAAAELGDEVAMEHYRELLRSWIMRNPLGASASDYAWFDMSVGLRAVVLAFAVDHFGDDPLILDALRSHGEFLASGSHYDSRGNHGLHQDLGLVVVAQLLSRSDWLSIAHHRVQEMFFDAIDAQGVCREGCIDYQYRNYRWYGEARTRLAAAGIADLDWMDQRLELMPEFLAHATMPNGEYVLIGDTLRHRAPRIEETAADWLRDRSRAPAKTVRVFDSGYLFARTSWATANEDERVAFISQRFGPGRSAAVHGHEDGGSVTLSLGEDDLLRDSGLYAYEAGAARLYARGRESHNVIDVPGRDFYPSAETELVRFQEGDDAVFSHVRSRSLRGVRWDRTLLWLARARLILVDDRVRLDSAEEVVQRWHLQAGTRFEFNSPSSFSGVLSSGAWIDFRTIGTVQTSLANGSVEPLEGWVSEAYRSLTPAPTLGVWAEGDSVRLTTLITYGARGSERARVQRFDRTSAVAALGLKVGKTSWAVALASDGFVVNHT